MDGLTDGWMLLTLSFLCCMYGLHLYGFYVIAIEPCDTTIYIVWHQKNIFVLYHTILFVWLCGRSNSLQQYFWSFRGFTVFHMVWMQAGDLHESNMNKQTTEENERVTSHLKPAPAPRMLGCDISYWPFWLFKPVVFAQMWATTEVAPTRA